MSLDSKLEGDTERLSDRCVTVTPLPAGIIVERDVFVEMRDGIRLALNVFRPAEEGRYPVLMAISPYGKDDHDGFRIFTEFEGGTLGEISVSDHTAFEAADPGYWVPRGYIVIQVDVRGQGKSEGLTNTMSAEEQADYLELITWASRQLWSDGGVALIGVSYLAITQWFVAQHRPPALKAIVPWEGWTEPYGRAYFGGIREVGFRSFVFDAQILPAHNPACGFVQLTEEESPDRHPLRDHFWISKSPNIERIDVPALICGSFSDQGLHTRDTFEAFRRIGSRQKWLYSHRQPKWHAFYSEEALQVQQLFLDYFMKGLDRGIKELPRVQYHVNETREKYEQFTAADWPPPEATIRTLFLSHSNCLVLDKSSEAQSYIEFDGQGPGAVFVYDFDEDTVLVGNMKAALWVESIGSDDMDLFVAVRKIDVEGGIVDFYGFSGLNGKDCVARGWQRVSHRATDPTKSTPMYPHITHAAEQLLAPGEIAQVEVEILPSATLFRKGEKLQFIIQGHQIQPDTPLLQFVGVRNKGRYRIHLGGPYHSHLLVSAFPNPNVD